MGWLKLSLGRNPVACSCLHCNENAGPKKDATFFTSYMTISFSRRALFHGFNCNYKCILLASLTIQTEACEGKKNSPVLPRTSCFKIIKFCQK